MRIDVPGELVDLLFVRAAWSVAAPPGLPPAGPPPSVGTSRRPARAGIDELWAALWDRALGRAGVLDASIGLDGWREVLGTDGIDREALRSWSTATRMCLNAVITEHDPHRSFASTVLARRAESGGAAGLTSFLVVPLTGPYAAWLAADRLLVSHETYVDDASWARAITGQQA